MVGVDDEGVGVQVEAVAHAYGVDQPSRVDGADLVQMCQDLRIVAWPHPQRHSDSRDCEHGEHHPGRGEARSGGQPPGDRIGEQPRQVRQRELGREERGTVSGPG